MILKPQNILNDTKNMIEMGLTPKQNGDIVKEFGGRAGSVAIGKD
jgi:hypothetical protein